MIVTLTKTRFAKVQAVSRPEVVVSMVVTDEHGSSVRVCAPYIAWELAKQSLMDAHLTPHGTANRRGLTWQNSAGLMAIQAISQAQNAYLRHPALRAKGMAGIHHEWFPVWEAFEEDGPHLYSPVPNNERFVVLGPVWLKDSHYPSYTMWSTEGLHPLGHPLGIEATHLSVLGEDR